ncbi:hypothetical protein CTI14_71655, partial [Methylobacterium radiotolerans]
SPSARRSRSWTSSRTRTPPAHGTRSAGRTSRSCLDAVLALGPEIALVDEFAHTNAPGSRNPKRWQDVEEL